MYRRILVPLDGSPCSEEAIANAVTIAQAMASSIVFLFVMEPQKLYREGVVSVAEARETLAAQGKEIVGRARDAAISAGVGADAELAEGAPADVILDRAPAFDLVVMGSHGASLWERLTLGSVTQAVLHRIARPLLVVRAGGTMA